MSYFRESPSKSYRRSPPRLPGQLIEDQIHFKNALRNESQNRRLLDEIALLQIKLRKTEELQAKCDGLIKQNSLLAQENDHLARELAERRYDVERLKSNTVQLQERDAIKTNQLGEINRSLELEIELLKKERLESNKLYESHIQKLQFMLEDKIKELDILSLRCNDLINEKEVNEIHFEEEKNKLKNLMARTTHENERELEYTKQKQTTEKYIEIETLKKNYASQILLLEDQIGKLKQANDYKNNEFEAQLADNKNIRNRYEQQLKNLENQNGSLREKILKLEELNRSEVNHIEHKYKDLQKKDTTELISAHVQEIKTLINEIDKLNWLLRQKNQEIQNLIRDKKQQKALEEQRELALRAEIDTLKNKLEVENDKNAQENQQLNARINSLSNKLLRDSEAYHERVNGFRKTINDLEGELKSKQNQLDTTRADSQLRARQLQRSLEEVTTKLDKTTRDLSDSQLQNNKLQRQYNQLQQNSNEEIAKLNKKNRQLETDKQELIDRSRRASENSGDAEKILKLQIEALTKNVAILEKKLSEEQRNHSKEMSDLADNLKNKIEKLQANHRKTQSEVEQSRANQMEALERRLDKAERERNDAQKKLAEYVRMYEQLKKFFAKPHEGYISTERGDNSIYEVLSKVAASTINIF